ncbi:Crp/Fnr family transcriptional regulator [Olivibacter jilunii]|uniref:Crp/Fnr family transcriptional regulator n=1 Tax=Olivibacter jilunii TaxID=985016 RepID=UPI001031177A|nr:Crp/Fnr family transcriptional regulator [Olivibacter jilunii]
MFEIFEKYLRESADISEQDMAIICSSCTIKNIRKWQPIHNEGEVWKSMCFIASGCFRLYRYDKNGTDHTVRFGIENWWMTDPESYNYERPSGYNIEALSASTIILWDKAQWDELLQAIPALKLFYERLIMKAFETSQQRIYWLISGSAEERYLEFQKTYPTVFNKVPLHMVASYLGISRETLSRVRKELTKPTKGN